MLPWKYFSYHTDDTQAEGTETASESEAPPVAVSADPEASQPLEQIQEGVEPPAEAENPATGGEDSAADPNAEVTADTVTEEAQ